MTFSLRLQIIFVTVDAAYDVPQRAGDHPQAGFIAGIAMVALGTAHDLAAGPGGLKRWDGAWVWLSIGAGLLYAGYALSVRSEHARYEPAAGLQHGEPVHRALMLLMFIFARDIRTGAMTWLER